jgi:hypothetical protein
MQVAAAALFGAAALRQPYPYEAGHAMHTIVSFLDLTECLTAWVFLVVWSKISDPCVAEGLVQEIYGCERARPWRTAPGVRRCRVDERTVR